MANQSNLNVTILENDNDIHKRYARIYSLGAGCFGETYCVLDLKDPRRRRYAMKVQIKDYPGGMHPDGPHGESMRLFREVLILNRIVPKHPNIIEIKEVLISREHLYIVTELCAKGRDFTAFCGSADNVTGRRAFLQLVEAVQTLHAHGIVHCDIKSDNILFKDSRFTHLKLIDFGASVFKPDWATKVNDGFDHTKWFSPDEISKTHDCRSVDIAALGCMLHDIMSGKGHPQVLTDRIRQFQTVYRPRTELFDEAAMDLLSKIGPEPFGPREASKLLTLDQIRAHPWLNWVELRGKPWHPSEPAHHRLSVNLTELRNDLLVLQTLLKHWSVIPLIDVKDQAGVSYFYEVIGKLQRGDETTRAFEVVNSLTRTRLMEMRFIFGKVPGIPQVIEEGYEVKHPHLLYLELLIMFRILPPNERFVFVRSVFVNQMFVALVRERLEGLTMIGFCSHYAHDNRLCRRVFKLLAQAVRLMHQYGVVHMDLHPQHIAWKTISPYSQWKIVDFSKARFVPQMALLRHESFRHEAYLTPDLLQMGGDAKFQVDISALGRILHAMMAGIWEQDPALCANHHPRRQLFEDAASDLLSKIGPEPWGPPAKNRTITVEEILLHPWFRANE